MGPLKLQKELRIAFYPNLYAFSFFFEIAQVYLCLAGCRVFEGHLKNERVTKTFRMHPKRSKFFCIIYALFVEIPRYLEIRLIHFAKLPTIEDSTQSIGGVNHFLRKCR